MRSLRALIEANLGPPPDRAGAAAARASRTRTRCASRTWTAASGCLRAPVILIATGSYPNWPDGVPLDPERSTTATRSCRWTASRARWPWSAPGVIGCEYATMFRAMGVEVTPRRAARTACCPSSTTSSSERAARAGRAPGPPVLLNESASRRRAVGRPRWRLRLESGGTARGRSACSSPRAAWAHARPRASSAWASRRAARPPEGERALPDRGPAHLRRGRRDRLPGAGLDLDGAGAGGHVPRLRPQVQVTGLGAAAHGRLHHPRDRGGGRDRGELPARRGSPTAWVGRATSDNEPRADHRGRVRAA